MRAAGWSLVGAVLVVGLALLGCKNRGHEAAADAGASSTQSGQSAVASAPAAASSSPNVAPARARGVAVTVKNEMSKTVTDVVLEYKGGTAKIASIAPASQVETTVPRIPNGIKFVDGSRRRNTFKNQFEMDGNQGVVTVSITAKGTASWDIGALSTVD